MIINIKTGFFSASLVYTGMALLSSPSCAALLDLADTPLFLGGAVTPNVFLMMDDSGSMDRDILAKSHWQGRAYDPDFGPDNNDGNDNFGQRKIDDGYIWAYGSHCDEESDDCIGGWDRRYGYIFNNRDDINNYACGSAMPGIRSEECPDNEGAVNLDWRTRSAALNVIYYNPGVDYKPWPGTDSAGNPSFENADFTQARSNPQPGTAGNNNPPRDLAGFVYETWNDDKGFADNPDGPLRGDNHNKTDGQNGIVDLWDQHTSFTFNADNTVTVKTFVCNVDENTGRLSKCKDDDPNVPEKILSGTEPHAELGGRTIAEAKQNIANWYQYYRRRSMAVNGATARVLDAHPNLRYGLSAINALDELFVEVPDTTDLAVHNRALLNQLFSHQTGGRTPLRSGLARVGDYYSNKLTGKGDPIEFACRHNFTLLFTDGLWSDEDPSSFGDIDLDGKPNTLADVARHYYVTDLSTLPDRVPVSAFDQNKSQHMVTYTIAFGRAGTLQDKNGAPTKPGEPLPDGWPDEDRQGQAISEGADWGNPSLVEADKIDDLWHAAFNSKGGYIAAQTPDDVVTDLTNALTIALGNIDLGLSSGSSAALNTGSLSSKSLLFQAGFDSDDWSGRLSAYRISDGMQTEDLCANLPPGEICGYPDKPEWAAHVELDKQRWDTGREIVTYNGTQGIPFRWPAEATEGPQSDELNATQIASLNKNIRDVVDDLGAARVEFLRGNRDIAGFRQRSHVLGDIIHSSPVLVQAPNFVYPSDWEDKRRPDTDVMPENAKPYTSWRLNPVRLNRKHMVYVAANDGMIHAFNAGSGKFDRNTNKWDFGDGKELMAYIPGLVTHKLNRLTDPDYTHEYFADSALTVTEAFFSGDWHTVLAGGLGKGAQGIVALDITDPSQLTEGNAQDIVLWEFGDRDDSTTVKVEGDPDMGYAFHQPVNIARMHDDNWYAIFGNGYNSTEPDGSDSTSKTGNAVLFLLEFNTGRLVKIDTQAGPTGDAKPNALATPAPVDVDGDFIVDYIYAGDLFGNLWKFDVTSHRSGDWDVIKENTVPTPLFTAKDVESRVQPITTRIQAGRPVGDQYLAHPLVDNKRYDNLMLYFGTGKYIEWSDNRVNDKQPTQSFYAIWDPMLEDAKPALRGDLLQQTILKEIEQNGSSWRTTSNYNIPGYRNEDAASWWTIDDQGVPDTTKPDKRGWYIDLVDPTDDSNNNRGERIAFDAVLRGDRVIFTTILPSDPEDPCKEGGDSWLMELDRVDGSRLSFTPFDVNQDGEFMLDDFIIAGDVNQSDKAVPAPPSGHKYEDKLIIKPTIIDAPDASKEFKIIGDNKGGLNVLSENNTGDVGRQGWRQIQE